MKYLKFSSHDHIQSLLSNQSFGDKLGNHVSTVSKLDGLYSNGATFALLIIPTISTVSDFNSDSNSDEILKPILNIEQNPFNDGSNLLILGELDSHSILKEIDKSVSDLKQLETYRAIETKVYSEIVTSIFHAGKIPIVIGGNSRHTSHLSKSIGLEANSNLNLLDISSRFNLSFEKEMINEDDLDAYQLNKYDAFGLSKNYVSAREYAFMSTSKRIGFQWYDDCLHLTSLDKCVKLKNAVDFLQRNLGFKLDLNCMEGISPSTASSSGFSVRDIRTFLKMLRKEEINFVHFCGFDSQIPATKSILSFFISDFIRNEN